MDVSCLLLPGGGVFAGGYHAGDIRFNGGPVGGVVGAEDSEGQVYLTALQAAPRATGQKGRGGFGTRPFVFGVLGVGLVGGNGQGSDFSELFLELAPGVAAVFADVDVAE